MYERGMKGESQVLYPNLISDVNELTKMSESEMQ
jgi:hypothetical protein